MSIETLDYADYVLKANTKINKFGEVGFAPTTSEHPLLFLGIVRGDPALFLDDRV